MLTLHMKVKSRRNKLLQAYIFKDKQDFIVRVYKDLRLIASYFTSNETEAIQEAQLSLI